MYNGLGNFRVVVKELPESKLDNFSNLVGNEDYETRINSLGYVAEIVLDDMKQLQHLVEFAKASDLLLSINFNDPEYDGNIILENED